MGKANLGKQSNSLKKEEAKKKGYIQKKIKEYYDKHPEKQDQYVEEDLFPDGYIPPTSEEMKAKVKAERKEQMDQEEQKQVKVNASKEKEIIDSVNRVLTNELKDCIIIPRVLYEKAIKVKLVNNQIKITGIHYVAKDAVQLYGFYLFNRLWQQTDVIFCSNKYCMNYFKWGKKRLLDAKNMLRKWKLISMVEKEHPDYGLQMHIKVLDIVRN